MAKTAICPGTFDPITHGHVDLIRRACCLFDHIVVAVAVNTRKQSYFSLEQRLEWVRLIFKDHDQVRVLSFSGLLIDFLRSQKSTIIVRGVRTGSDFDYETQLAGINHQLAPELETIFLTPSTFCSHLSSSMVREIFHLGGNVRPFVHAEIAQDLEKMRGEGQ